MRSSPKNPPFEIGGEKVKPGERKTVELHVTNLYTHTPISLTVHVVHGTHPGPCLFVCAAIHGDELNGVEIIRRLLKTRGLRFMRGTLLAVPIVNVLGFLHHSRYFPDRRDLNRSFPGTNTGSLAGQTAALFMEHVVKPATHGIDLHTAALHRSNLHQTRGLSNDPVVDGMARAFGVPVHLHTNLQEGTLRHSAHVAGVPVLLYEAGEALRIDEISIRAGVQGVLRVMRHLGLLPKRSKPTITNRSWCTAHSSQWVRAPVSGLAYPIKTMGSHIRAGEVVAKITNPVGTDVTDVTATREGLIIGISKLPVVTQGDALFHIAFVPDAEILEGMVQESLVSLHEGLDGIVY